MNILLASSEVVPFAKTGGLADVSGALPIEIAKLGHRPIVFMPAYRAALQSGQPIEPYGDEFSIPIGSKIVAGSYLKSRLPNSDVDVVLVSQPEYFDRAGLYQENGEDYPDNCERFVFFCRAVMEGIRTLGLHVDLIHCNDWQTGLIPAYLALEYRHAPRYAKIASMLTIHNLAYQGNFWHWDMLLTGLDWRYFNWRQMEFFGRLNLLKTGIVFANSLTTVSPRYAQEIQTSELGCGLEGVLSHRTESLHGIINGIDETVWNPSIDPHLAANYDVNNWRDGKTTCKRALQEEMGLPTEAAPLIGLIGRLAEQKGWTLIIDLMKNLVPRTDVQWVVLGTGEPSYQQALEELAAAYPTKVAVRMAFSDAIAHRIEAGSDMFLMPSRYEPCGLNQLYSLKYGTVPIVHETGGLADTIVDFTGDAARDGASNGFQFREYRSEALLETVRRALEVFTHHPDQWGRLVECGMRQDWSWSRSARQYVSLYEQLAAS
ncbi:MAG: glycogen synthase GlgA [Planctomycetales bacterium]|nr:glycogen synthase GlgA [Planctomycetales bacterium]